MDFSGTKRRPASLLIGLLVATTGLGAEALPPVGIAMGSEPATSLVLTLGSRRVSLTSDGGFRLHDATTRQDLRLDPGKVTRAVRGATFEAKSADVRVRAEFAEQGDHVVVRGNVENLRGDERGFTVDFQIPRLSADAVFSQGLNDRLPMSRPAETEGSVFPLAAMSAPGVGVALAIPPAEPRVFGLVGSEQGMAIRFYLGTTPKSARFPNRASFVFLIYAVEPAWGFRSALSRYYRFFPEYYTPRMPSHGLMMFQMADRVPPNVEQYGFDEVEPQWDDQTLRSAIARDDRHGISTFPYMIVGQREIKFLPKLPATYDEAMRVFDRWSVADHAGHALTKENAAAQGDIHLKEEVTTSACMAADGRYALVLRKTEWGLNSVTFKINPNPDLFADRGRKSTGAHALELQEKWLDRYPGYDGVFVDSLGANWPAVLNYRPDHFKYARYPLTFDPQGKVALQNTLSHYEYLETLRERMRARDRLILGNGVYAYPSRRAPAAPTEKQRLDPQFTEYTSATAAPEHPRPGARLGRFFLAALLDAASSEAGVHATIERCQDVRIHLGPKQYAFLNYRWENPQAVEDFLNISLCFAIFGSNTKNFFTGVEYEDNPSGYYRDKPLLDWFVPLARTLSRAGWEPLRYATIEGRDVFGERFGHGDVVYFTLYNNGTSPVRGTLTIDLGALGFAEGKSTIAEVSRNASLDHHVPGTVVLDLAPKKTYVIKVSRGDPLPATARP